MAQKYYDEHGAEREPFDWEMPGYVQKSSWQQLKEAANSDGPAPQRKPVSAFGIFMAVVLALLFFFVALPIITLLAGVGLALN